MTLDELIKRAQSALGVKVDGDWGPASRKAADEHDLVGVSVRKKLKQAPIGKAEPASRGPKWYLWAKALAGKRETDESLIALLVPTWAKLGLPGYKKLAGKAFAWCGVAAASALIATGYSYQKNGAAARNWAKFGQEIDWRANGIPRGAIMHINGASNCNSASSNHVTFADGDCAASDLGKGASVPGYGGNQADSFKRSMYPVADLCAVRWPSEEQLPPPVKASVDCAGKASSGESTR